MKKPKMSEQEREQIRQTAKKDIDVFLKSFDKENKNNKLSMFYDLPTVYYAFFENENEMSENVLNAIVTAFKIGYKQGYTNQTIKKDIESTK